MFIFTIIGEDLFEVTLADIWGIHNKDTENRKHGTTQVKGPAGSKAGSDRPGRPLTSSDRHDRPPKPKAVM